MSADARSAAVARLGRSHASPIGRVVGLGSLFGKTLRDSRRAALIVGALLAVIAVATASQLGSQFATQQARQEIVGSVAQMPAIFRGLLGDPINATTLGGYLSWRTLNSMPLFLGIWSILALSSTLAGEARRGSLEVLLGTPLSRRAIALHKVAAHLVAVAIAMTIGALGLILAGAALGTLPGDAISPAAAFGHMAWLFLMTIVGGAAAFAASPIVSRSAAAGIGAAVLFGSFVVSSFRASIPAFEPLSLLSPFRWTAGHRPLAGVAIGRRWPSSPGWSWRSSSSASWPSPGATSGGRSAWPSGGCPGRRSPVASRSGGCSVTARSRWWRGASGSASTALPLRRRAARSRTS